MEGHICEIVREHMSEVQCISLRPQVRIAACLEDGRIWHINSCKKLVGCLAKLTGPTTRKACSLACPKARPLPHSYSELILDILAKATTRLFAATMMISTAVPTPRKARCSFLCFFSYQRNSAFSSRDTGYTKDCKGMNGWHMGCIIFYIHNIRSYHI